MNAHVKVQVTTNALKCPKKFKNKKLKISHFQAFAVSVPRNA